MASRARRDADSTAAGAAPAPAIRSGLLVTAPVPTPAPDIDLLAADGRRFSLADARGQVVVVNLWATWCTPCVRELPSLVRLARTLAGRHPGRFKVVAVSADEDPAATRRFLSAPAFAGLQDDLVVAFGPGAVEVARAFPCRGRGACNPEEARLPETYVVDQQGRIVALVVGEVDWSGLATMQYLEALLGG